MAGIGLENKNPDEYQLLDFFLAFINADIHSLSVDGLKAFTKKYVDFICPHIFIEEEPQRIDKYNQFSPDIFDQSSSGIFKEREKFFFGLQKLLKEKMSHLVDPDQVGEHRTDNMDIVSSLIGTSTICVNRRENIFEDKFIADRLGPGDEFEPSKIEPLAELVFAILIRTYNLIPRRFGTCRNCGNYYYNKKGRGQKMLYCSVKCANAYRWNRHKKRER